MTDTIFAQCYAFGEDLGTIPEELERVKAAHKAPALWPDRSLDEPARQLTSIRDTVLKTGLPLAAPPTDTEERCILDARGARSNGLRFVQGALEFHIYLGRRLYWGGKHASRTVLLEVNAPYDPCRGFDESGERQLTPVERVVIALVDGALEGWVAGQA